MSTLVGCRATLVMFVGCAMLVGCVVTAGVGKASRLKEREAWRAEVHSGVSWWVMRSPSDRKKRREPCLPNKEGRACCFIWKERAYARTCCLIWKEGLWCMCMCACVCICDAHAALPLSARLSPHMYMHMHTCLPGRSVSSGATRTRTHGAAVAIGIAPARSAACHMRKSGGA